MKRLIWSGVARRALVGLVDHYGAIDPALAGRIVDLVVSTPAKLLAFPHMGAPTADPAIRTWRARPLPFILIYRVTRTGITVLDVRHAAREMHRR